MNRFSFSPKNLKNNLKGLITLVCVVSLLFLTQACSGTTAVGSSGSSDYHSREQLGQNAYDIKNSPKSGMNGFDDTDPRANHNRANRKAKDLIENADRSFNNGKTVFDNVGDSLSKTNTKDVTNNLAKAMNNAGEQVENTTANLAKGAERGIKNIRDNAENAPDYLSRTGQVTTNR